MELGADPEAFFANKAGRAVSAHRIFPALSKHVGKKVDRRGKLTRDGFTIEVNPLPTTCREGLAYNVHYLLQAARREARKHGCSVVLKSAMPVGPRQLKDAPEDACTFGCDRSWNAYTNEPMMINIPDPLRHGYRYAGGHMHASPVHPGLHRDVIRVLDLVVGVPLTYLYQNEPEVFLRRRYYGQAGDYRPQVYTREVAVGLALEGTGVFKDNRYIPAKWRMKEVRVHGLEYRTPGPEYWRSAVTASLAYGLFRWGIERYRAILPTARKNEALIVGAINTGENLRRAMEVVSKVIPAALLRVKDLDTVRSEKKLWALSNAINGWGEYSVSRLDDPSVTHYRHEFAAAVPKQKEV